MNRSVLIVTPFFAPQSHAAVFRAYKLAKYLPQHGWKPYVVTTDINYRYNEDQQLLDALPSEVEIYRTRYIEPTLRGIRMALGGRDRTLKAHEVPGDSNANGELAEYSHTSGSNALRRFYQYLLAAWLQNPDAYWPWKRPTLRVAKDLLRRHQIPLVYTSADPFTSHQIGYQLQRQCGVRWIADFRDPATHCFWMHSSHNRVFVRQRRAERLALDHADTVVVQALAARLVLTEMYGLRDDHPIEFIPTGLDENLLTQGNEDELPSHPYLLFVGEFLAGYGEQFFRVISQAIQNPQVAETGVKMLFIGRKDVNAPLLAPIIKKYGLERHTQLIDHMPQEELYCYLQGAKAVLLISGQRAAWWRLFAKLVDYIALQRPVIAMVPDPSEARTHLQRSGLGVFLEGDEPSSVEKLTNFLLDRETSLQIDQQYCERFLVREQLSSFVEVFQRQLA